MYVTFPVWSDCTLKDLRERKQVAEEKAVMAADRLKEHSEKMEATNNLIQKALHFREACKAAEEIDYSGYRTYRSMPLHREMISVNGGLNVCTLGTGKKRRNVPVPSFVPTLNEAVSLDEERRNLWRRPRPPRLCVSPGR